MRNRGGFTVLELILVAVIMLILASLLLVGIGRLGDRAKEVLTKQRIESVHSGLSRLGLEFKTLSFALQSRVSGFGGTAAFERKTGEDQVSPKGIAPWHAVFPDAAAVAPGNPVVEATGDGAPLILAYPWGQQRRYFIREGWYANAFTPALPVSDPNAWSDSQYAQWLAPERHRIHELWPKKSAEILSLLELAKSVDDYRNDRDKDRTWNDAWGNPLVVSYALYQPSRYLPASVNNWQSGRSYVSGDIVEDNAQNYTCILEHTSNSSRRPTASGGGGYWRENVQKVGYYLERANRLYQYNRSTYIAVGAPGQNLHPQVFDQPRIPSGLSANNWDQVLTGLWYQICAVTMPGAGDEWTETGFDRPPWEGITMMEEVIDGTELNCFLSAPIEYK